MKREYIHPFEIEVFEDTRKRSYIEFEKDTKKLCKKDTIVYKTPITNNFDTNKDMEIEFVAGGTVSTGYELANTLGKRVAILNFADALEPGGLVRWGGITQEENICRCSNLYESLLVKKCDKDYYKYNNHQVRMSDKHFYTNRIIYSRDVTIFKDDVTYDLIDPLKLDVITCPAPSGIMHNDVAYYIMNSRTDEIIKSAALNNVKVLVLGAWGCGAFGQNPYVVGRCFAESLKKYKCFDKVVFAVRPCLSNDGGNYDRLKDAFEEYYG